MPFVRDSTGTSPAPTGLPAPPQKATVIGSLGPQPDQTTAVFDQGTDPSLPNYAPSLAPGYVNPYQSAINNISSQSAINQAAYQASLNSLVKSQQDLYNQQQAQAAAGYQGNIQDLLSKQAQGLATLQPQLANIDINNQASDAALNQKDVFARANLADQADSRGLGTSGIALGMQARDANSLSAQLAAQDTQAAQQKQAIANQIASLNSTTAGSVAQLQTKLNALGNIGTVGK